MDFIVEISILFHVRYGNNISPHIIPFGMGLVGVARTGSVYMTMSITVERYFAIVHPLKDFISLKKYLLPATITFSLVYNIPKVFNTHFVNLCHTNLKLNMSPDIINILQHNTHTVHVSRQQASFSSILHSCSSNSSSFRL